MKSPDKFIKLNKKITSVVIGFVVIVVFMNLLINLNLVPYSLFKTAFILDYVFVFIDFLFIVIILVRFLFHFTKYRETKPSILFYFTLLVLLIVLDLILFYTMINLAFAL